MKIITTKSTTTIKMNNIDAAVYCRVLAERSMADAIRTAKEPYGGCLAPLFLERAISLWKSSQDASQAGYRLAFTSAFHGQVKKLLAAMEAHKNDGTSFYGQVHELINEAA